MNEDQSVRTAGFALIVGSLIGAGVGIYEANRPSSPGTTAFLVSQLVVIVANALALAGVWGLARSRAAGKGALAVTGETMALIASALFLPLEVYLFFDLETAGMLLGIASMVQALGLLFVGIAVLRAGVWTGWRRFAPHAVGLYTFLVLIPALALSPEGYNGWALAGWQVVFLLLGIALWQHGAAPRMSLAHGEVQHA